MRTRSLLLTLLATVVVLLPGSASATWGDRGSYGVRISVELEHTFFVPQPLTGRHPVVIWGNGTYAIPGFYSGLLEHLASQGFIVAAANTPMSRDAVSMRAGLDLLTARNADPANPLYGHVDLSRVGAAGHSQGGSAAINADADPRVTTVVAIEPGERTDLTRLKSPTLFLSGEYDILIPPATVKGMYDRSPQIPAVYAEMHNGTHITPIGDGGPMRAPITAWLRYRLLGDPQARAAFVGPSCGYCADPLWTSFLRNPAMPAS